MQIFFNYEIVKITNKPSLDQSAMKRSLQPVFYKALFLSMLFILINTSGSNHLTNVFTSDIVLANFSYSGQYLDISANTSNARASHWKPDGSMIFVTGRSSANVAAYAVEDPWQVSTATFVKEVKIPGQNLHGLFIHPEGDKMWIFDRTSIWDFNLSTPWDITSACQGRNTSLEDFIDRGHDIDFTPDGSIIFIDDRNSGNVFALHLEIPWDVTTGLHIEILDISDIQKEVRGVEFIHDGTVMVLMDTGRNELLEYRLTKPFNILTATLVNTFSVQQQTRQGRGLSFSANHSSFYVTGTSEEKIFQYNLNKQPGN